MGNSLVHKKTERPQRDGKHARNGRATTQDHTHNTNLHTSPTCTTTTTHTTNGQPAVHDAPQDDVHNQDGATAHDALARATPSAPSSFDGRPTDQPDAHGAAAGSRVELAAPPQPHPAQAAAGPADEYERDTTAPEDEDWAKLLLPNGALPLQGFSSLSYSMPCLRGWVKQRSPACAAASLAGAFNACTLRTRDDVGALSQDEMLEVFAANVETTVRKKMARIERMIGCAPGEFGRVDEAFRERVERGEKPLSGKKGVRITRREALRLFREVVARAAAPDATEDAAGSAVAASSALGAEKSAAESCSSRPGPFSLLDQMLRAELSAFGADDEIEGDENDEDALEESSEARPVTMVKKSVRGKRAPERPLHAELGSLYTAIGGLLNLRKERPSTSYCGNADLANALSALSAERTDVCLTITPIVGRAPSPKGAQSDYIRVASGDSSEVVEAQWRALQAHFSRTRRTLLFHLTNHYALVFAIREHVDPSTGEAVREILTSRKGQRPSSWITWQEVRRTLIKWTGYKLMAVDITYESEESLRARQQRVAESLQGTTA